MTPADALTRLRAGAHLHMQLVDGRRVWWFEAPYAEVDTEIVDELRAEGRLTEKGDCLFGLPELSQTWGGVAVSKSAWALDS